MSMASEKYPLVGIVMGSDSDLPIMEHAGRALAKFDIAHEYGIKSAHRTPEKMVKYGHEAVERGLKVIIAGAGGSAHLQGMLASETRLPVLGVAIESSPDGLNSAFGSMVRMPEGVPLATMGKNQAGAANAGLEAVRILALSDPILAAQYDIWAAKQREAVERKDELLDAVGVEDYLLRMKEVKEGKRESLFD